MFFLISYDIKDDRRRIKVAKVLKDYAERVQFSVFEANIDQNQLKRLDERVNEILNQEEDSLRIYPLCAECMSKVMISGCGELSQDPDFIVI